MNKSKLETYALNNLRKMNNKNYIEYMNEVNEMKTHNNTFFIQKNKNINHMMLKANRKELVSIDFLFSINELEELISETELFTSSMRVIDGWDKLLENYKSLFEKNRASCLNLKLKNVSFEAFTILNMFIDFSINHLFIYFNHQIEVAYDKSLINRFYDDGTIHLQLEVTQSRLTIQDYFKNIYSNLYDNQLQVVKKDTIKQFISNIQESFSKELFMKNNNNLDEDNKELLFDILRDKKSPLNIYFTHLLENENIIDSYYKEIKEHNNPNKDIEWKELMAYMAGPKRKFSLFSRKKEKNVEEVITKEMKTQEEMLNLLNDNIFHEFRKIMMDIELYINISVRLNERYGLYIQHLLIKDLKLIHNQFNQNSFTLEQKELLINDLFIKVKSFQEVIKLIIPKENDSSSINQTNQADKVEEIRDILKL